MSGTIGITPIGQIGVFRVPWLFARRAATRGLLFLRRVRAAGGLSGAAAVPVAVALTTTVTWVIVTVAGAVGPT